MSNFVACVPAGAPEDEIISLDAAKLFLNLINDDTKNDLVTSLIVGARQDAEEYTWRSLAKKPYVQTMDGFPGHHEAGILGFGRRVYSRGHYAERQVIKLWKPPLISVEGITYIGTDGDEHNLSAGDDFQVDVINEPGRIAPLPGQVWPLTMHGSLNAVRIFFTAGYEVESISEQPSDPVTQGVAEPETEVISTPTPPNQVALYTVDRTIPTPLVTVIKQLVTHRFQNRDPVIAQAGGGGKFSILPWHLEQTLDTYSVKDFFLVP